MPELVHKFPSTTHRAVAVHFTFPPPNDVAHSHAALFVVARRPFNTPDLASVAAPVQTLSRYFNEGYREAISDTARNEEDIQIRCGRKRMRRDKRHGWDRVEARSGPGRRVQTGWTDRGDGPGGFPEERDGHVLMS